MKKTFYLIVFYLIFGILLAQNTVANNESIGDKDYIEPKPYNSNRLLIKHGLQLPCWVSSDDPVAAKGYTHAYTIHEADWAATGFTCPTFFVPPLYSDSFFKLFPDSQWSIAKGPYGRRADEGGEVMRMPNSNEHENGYLSEKQMSQVKNFVSICFGDEEYYKDSIPLNLKEWYAVSRKHYPDVLVHNNQYTLQWTIEQLRGYVKTSKPDLVTYDTYAFNATDNEKTRRSTWTAEHLMTYRMLAMEGWDGTGKDYIAFGQYSQGFVSDYYPGGPNGANDGSGRYHITEAQLRFYYYMTWTFGGKWLNWFRYLQGGDDGEGGSKKAELCLLLKDGQPGKHTKHMNWVNRCNTESKFIGDYLVRLLSTKIYYKMGTFDYSDPDGEPDRDRKNEIKSFPDLHKFTCNNAQNPVKNISGVIKGTKKDAGDLYIGLFKIIPKKEQGDPSFFKNRNAQFFMITNSYTTNKLSTSADELSQTIAIEVESGKKLSWFNPYTLKDEALTKKSTSNDLDRYEVELWGGTGALFYLE